MKLKLGSVIKGSNSSSRLLHVGAFAPRDVSRLATLAPELSLVAEAYGEGLSKEAITVNLNYAPVQGIRWELQHEQKSSSYLIASS